MPCATSSDTDLSRNESQGFTHDCDDIVRIVLGANVIQLEKRTTGECELLLCIYA